jgi:hypothetical protein
MYAVKCLVGVLVKYVSMLTLLAFVTVFYSGCIWLAVPGLAYEGYRYEHQLNTPSSPAGIDRPSNSPAASVDNMSSDHPVE